MSAGSRSGRDQRVAYIRRPAEGRSGAEMEVKSLTASVDGLLTWDSFVAMC